MKLEIGGPGARVSGTVYGTHVSVEIHMHEPDVDQVSPERLGHAFATRVAAAIKVLREAGAK